MRDKNINVEDHLREPIFRAEKWVKHHLKISVKWILRNMTQICDMDVQN